MGIKPSIALAAAVLTLSGCVNSTVREWTAVGALSGAAAGAGIGYLISDDHVLGSEASVEGGDLELEMGSTMLASVIIGTVFGGIIGAMVGHQRYDADQDAYEARLEAEQGNAAVEINVDLGGLDEDGDDVELDEADLGGMDAEDVGLDEDDMDGDDADESDADEDVESDDTADDDGLDGDDEPADDGLE